MYALNLEGSFEPQKFLNRVVIGALLRETREEATPDTERPFRRGLPYLRWPYLSCWQGGRNERKS